MEIYDKVSLFLRSILLVVDDVGVADAFARHDYDVKVSTFDTF